MGLFTCDIWQYPETFGVSEYNVDGTRKAFDFDGPAMDFIHEGLPPNFLLECNQCMQSYFAGDWEACKNEIDAILEKKPEDGPMISLRLVLESYDFKAPSDWKGYRELTEK
jgi:hypothetical protein